MKIATSVVGKMANNTYLVISDKNNAVLIDPSVDFEKINKMLEESGANLKYIMFTHGHYDHTASTFELKEKTGAKLVIGERDAEMLCDIEKSMAWLFSNHPKEVYADITVNDGDVLTLDELEFKIIATPGHTKGSICIICEDVIFTGDTVLEGTVGRTDFYGGSEAFMLQSIKKLAQLSGDFKILAGHGPASTLLKEKTTNPYFIEYV